MPSVGSDLPSFPLQGREIRRDGDTLHGDDGVLAGSILTMDRAVRMMMEQGGVSLQAAVTMASATPAAFLGIGDRTGAIVPGLRADLVVLDAALAVRESWIAGQRHHLTRRRSGLLLSAPSRRRSRADPWPDVRDVQRSGNRRLSSVLNGCNPSYPCPSPHAIRRQR